jgi:hypothetical protein
VISEVMSWPWAQCEWIRDQEQQSTCPEVADIGMRSRPSEVVTTFHDGRSRNLRNDVRSSALNSQRIASLDDEDLLVWMRGGEAQECFHVVEVPVITPDSLLECGLLLCADPAL